MTTNDMQLSATIYKQLFTIEEWDAISSAMEDYADPNDAESDYDYRSEIASSIQQKIKAIFDLTSFN